MSLKDNYLGQSHNEFKIRLKRGRLIGAKDIVPQKTKLQELNKEIDTPEESMKQKKAIKMSILEKYIQQKHVIELMDKDQKVPERHKYLKIKR